ncbi:MAG: hypothetical protein MUF20_11655 [Methylotetracoccus sp.]|nr:hypothetical protein [Methylotetracoccus sp.]
MLPNPPSFLDWLQGLPLIQLAAWVIGIWLGIALLVHKAILPWAAGMDGRKLGTFSTGAAGLLGLMFALLLSINALSVWEQSGTAWNALRAEASALREIADLSSELSTERRRDVKVQLDAYLRYLVQTEWPRLGTHNVTLDRPLPLRSLARVVRAGSNDEMHGLMASAIRPGPCPRPAGAGDRSRHGKPRDRLLFPGAAYACSTVPWSFRAETH